MKIAQTNQLIENLIEWLKENLPIINNLIIEENPENIIPEYQEFKVGFIDVFKVSTFPTLILGIGDKKPKEIYSNIYTLDIVSVNKSFDKDATVKEGYLLSDSLTYLIKNNPHLDGSILSSEIVKVEYFQTDNFFMSDLSLSLEVEEGEI